MIRNGYICLGIGWFRIWIRWRYKVEAPKPATPLLETRYEEAA